MNEMIFKYEYLTTEARKILDEHKGYRDDTLFPIRDDVAGEKTDPINVVVTEIINCGKYEICDFFINHYQDILSRADYRLLTGIVSQSKLSMYPALTGRQKEQLIGIIRKIIGDSNYCVWLCSSMDDIYEQYLIGYIPKADGIEPGYAKTCPDYQKKVSLPKEEYFAEYISEIDIPNNPVLLCDLGKDGILIAFDGKAVY